MYTETADWLTLAVVRVNMLFIKTSAWKLLHSCRRGNAAPLFSLVVDTCHMAVTIAVGALDEVAAFSRNAYIFPVYRRNAEQSRLSYGDASDICAHFSFANPFLSTCVLWFEPNPTGNFEEWSLTPCTELQRLQRFVDDLSEILPSISRLSHCSIRARPLRHDMLDFKRHVFLLAVCAQLKKINDWD